MSIRKIIENYNPHASLSEASTVPASWYRDPRIFELEQRAVFSNAWQIVSRCDQVREPGCYITCSIAGEPVLVIRGNDGILRGFFNVCRHHAAAVMTEAEGKTQNLRCPYHGWAYSLEGALIYTPEFAGVADFERRVNGLVPIQIAEWQSWVAIKLEAGGPTLEEFLGDDVIEQSERLNLGHLNWLERRRYTVNCNWKVFVDNYLDGGYHVPHIHGALNSVLDYSNYTIETGERYCLQSSPIVTEKGDLKTAAVRTGKQARYYWIYPNFMINIYDGIMDTNLVVPRSVDKTDVVFDYYFADVSEHAREKNRASIAVSEQIQSEDVAICESVQGGLTSRSYDTGRLSVRREAGEHLFHKLLYADLQAAIETDTNDPIGR